MKFDISGNPDVGDLTVYLNAGDTIWAEAGAMSRMTSDLDMRVRMIGGFFKAVVRKLVGGESLFVGEYTAARDGMFISLAPCCPGSVMLRRLEGDSIWLTNGSFLACTPGVTLKTRFGGLKSFFSGEGAFFIECGGVGDLFFNAYGALIEKQVNGAFTVDTGHVVAWEPTLNYHIGGMGGLKQTLFSGEGLVMKFSGTGKIYLQTRHLGGLVNWLGGYVK
jgi:uncharacterized protein (TIGR00266 family)